jgi:hypothetical protein
VAAAAAAVAGLVSFRKSRIDEQAARAEGTD